MKRGESHVTGQPATELGRGRQPAKMVRKREKARRVKTRRRNSSMSEKPVHSRLRRLVDWINLTGAKKVHSLIDKVYKRKNLRCANTPFRRGTNPASIECSAYPRSMIACVSRRCSIG